MDFTLFQGDTKRVHFALTRADGTPLELTGAQLRWQASKMKGPGVFSPTPVLQKTETDGIEIDDESGGILTVLIEPEDTIGLSGEFYQELESIDADGDVATVFTGSFEVIKALIKPPVQG